MFVYFSIRIEEEQKVYLGISFILFAIQTIMMQGVFSVSLQAKYPRRKHLFLNGIEFVLMIGSIFARLNSEVDAIGNVLWTTVMILIFIIFLILLYSDKLWKRLLLFLLVYTGEILADIACNEILQKIGIQERITRNSKAFFQSMIIGTGLVIIILWTIAILWKCLFQQKKRKILYSLIIAFMMIIQLVFMNRASRSMALDLEINIRHEYTIIGISAFLSDFIFVLLIIEEKRNSKMNERLKELEYIQSLEAGHYYAIEEKEDELSKIRHDFKNQINTAYHLLALDKEQAEQLLKEMTNKLNESEVHVYSTNSMINAIMQEKAKQCEEKQIKLESAIKIGEIEGIKMVHMCSVFSNLLDNAIHATEVYIGGEKYIKVNAKRQGDYFIVSVKNASDKPELHKTKRKGYGREILKEIAAKYEGESDYYWKENEYCATVTLLGKPKVKKNKF